jgi:hypothetical protein
VLLTAYADTDAAIAAINEVRLDHYVLKPWDPPEERLYPIWTSCSTTGRPGSTRRSRASGSSATGGRPRSTGFVT